MAKIICIEDESGIREDIVEALEMMGHSIIQAENGAEGLSAILRERPDLAISDITMPVLDGLGLLATLRADHPEFADMPFVFLSALADRKDQITGRELGADEYLTKPVDFELMHVVVKARLRQVKRMQVNRDRQLLKMYAALTKLPVVQDERAARNLPVGPSLNIVVVANDELDLTAVRKALKADGHRLQHMKSGQQFLEIVGTLTPDLLLLGFNTQDMQAPAIIKALHAKGNYPFRKILLMPQSAPDFPGLGKLPHFDAHLREPFDCQVLLQHVTALRLELEGSESLLLAG